MNLTQSSSKSSGTKRSGHQPTGPSKLQMLILLALVFAVAQFFVFDFATAKKGTALGTQFFASFYDAVEVRTNITTSLVQETPVLKDKHATKNDASEDVAGMSDSNATALISTLRMNHPGCFSDALFGVNASSSEPDTTKELRVTEVFSYARIGHSVKRSVRYSHLCPHMKPRYNCAKRSEDVETSTDWKLNLIPDQQSKSDANVCNLWEFTDALGGPIGLANAVKALKGTNRTINILLQGDSFLRQVFEALTCGFHQDITNHWKSLNSAYGVSINDMKERHGLRVEVSQIGKLVTPPNAKTGTCKPSGAKQYYRYGVKLPDVCKYNESAVENYDDNVGMVEFGNKIRFYYLFRPYMFSNLTNIYSSLFRLDPRDVDVLVFNNGQDKLLESKYKKLVNIFSDRSVWQNRIDWDVEWFVDAQKRVTKYFGADNPWITHPPDMHPCMPGIPDDEANLMLFLIFSGAGISQKGASLEKVLSADPLSTSLNNNTTKVVVKEIEEDAPTDDLPVFILHVGPHKTATSAIQCDLTRNRKELYESADLMYLGILYKACLKKGWKDGHAFDTRLIVDRCFKEGNCEGKDAWERKLEAELSYFSGRGKSVILSDEAFARMKLTGHNHVDNRDLLYNLVSKYYPDHMRVAVVYRRYFEWQLSYWNENTKPFVSLSSRAGDSFHYKREYHKWPSEGGKRCTTFLSFMSHPEKEQSFFFANTNASSTNTAYTPESGNYRIDAEAYGVHAAEYLRGLWINHSDEVRLLNLHHLSASPSIDGEDATSRFLSALASPLAAETYILKKDSFAGHHNPSRNVNYDILAVAAHEKGLLANHNIPRVEVALLTEEHLLKKLNTTEGRLPLQCPDEKQLKGFFQKSLDYEEMLYPNQPNEAVKQHEMAFLKAVKGNKFCNFIFDEMLEDEAVKTFFTTDIPLLYRQHQHL